MDVNLHLVYTMKHLQRTLKEDAFNQEAAVGFIEIFGLPTKVKALLETEGVLK